MQSGQEVVQLHLDDIIPNRFQPREVFDERALKELAASIKEHGVIQPIIVRQVNNKYEIIAGERRYKASALAGMTKIPAIVNNLDDKEAAKVALLENLQRKNLNPIEEARTYQKILELDQMTQDSLAKTMGKSQSAVANKLRLLSLPDEIQLALLKDEISERHARALLNINDQEKQKELLNKIIDEKISVRSLEELIKNINITQEKEDGGEKMNNNEIKFNTIMPTSSEQSEEKPKLMEAFTNISEGNDNNIDDKKIKNNSIVNYGNIDDDEIDNEKFQLNDNLESSAGKNIDLDEMRNSTVDIDEIIKEQQKSEIDNNEKISNDLNSLLNIKDPVNNGFNPMQELIKQSDENNNQINKDDYFQDTDLMSIQLPMTDEDNSKVLNANKIDQQTVFNNNLNNNINQDNNRFMDMNNLSNKSFFNNNDNINQQIVNPNNKKTLGMALMEETYNLPKKQNSTTNELSINKIIEQIRNTIQLLEKKGATIDTDEIDFENQYQIVIRIDKNN